MTRETCQALMRFLMQVNRNGRISEKRPPAERVHSIAVNYLIGLEQ